MATLFRWMVRITFAVVAIAGLVVLAVYYFAARSLPDYDKHLTVEGINAPVEIVRDTANVPHIFGAIDGDVFYGLGYAHAQDRLWQMTVLRRTVQGRLSEVFGQTTVPLDTIMRRYDLYRLAEASVAVQDEYTTSALNAYAAGVNARLAEINRDALGRGAPEMFLFDAPISPWRPADSIALVKLMALQNIHQLDREVLRARTSRALPDAGATDGMLRDILPDAPGSGVAALPDYQALLDGLKVPRFAHAQPDPGLPGSPLSPFAGPGLGAASNAWAAAPTRSASGGTLLASDPHLGFTAPSIWYLARMELSTGGVIGATVPGIPVVFSGRSSRLGWGITSAYVDDLDVRLEELNPQNPEEYRTPDGFATFETRKSIIAVAEAKPLTLTLRWTQNGPVMPGSHKALGTITPAGHVATISWTGFSPQDRSLSAAMAVMRAGRVEDAIAAAEPFVAPAVNLVLADRLSVGMKTIGAIPRRNAQHESQGRMPTFGWKAQNRWEGIFPYAANPEFVSPQGGIVGNTNNKTVDRPFPANVSSDWGDTQRVARWSRLMQLRQVHTRDSFIEAQLDTVSPTARSLLPLVGRDLWFTGEPAPDGTPERRRQRALELLAEWNGEMNEHMPEPLIYAAWMRALQKRLIEDELGPLADAYTRLEPLFIERAFRNIDGAARWCDVVQSTPKETCADMAKLALDDALIWIGETWGTSLESLRWGDAHQAAHDHPTLGEVPLLRYFVNIRQSASGGDNTLNRGLTRGTGPDPFLDIHGAGYRGVYDFADPDSSVFVISTGQSGHPLSRHYDDMAQLWRRGEYVPMSLDEALARAGAVGVTVLEPAQ
ncbi:penicillin acylase family protein [Rhodalgimonas zhirmunskyi]|uniref:Penicillin acylase family protein n=1 Tax=Rhodalgimonas zhirmunskyi TaxID=2964767 RepID=A0AAJ1X2Z4_9RHOB|nr:penicillin acylase family protein [Rhodoalgimonas zhirmunskyi]MDQ2092813.1 penicillin acylase family protein [Rhodoalgimonas zhirmunskyi]